MLGIGFTFTHVMTEIHLLGSFVLNVMLYWAIRLAGNGSNNTTFSFCLIIQVTFNFICWQASSFKLFFYIILYYKGSKNIQMFETTYCIWPKTLKQLPPLTPQKHTKKLFVRNLSFHESTKVWTNYTILINKSATCSIWNRSPILLFSFFSGYIYYKYIMECIIWHFA